MSRGPGRVERAIEAAFSAQPSCVFTTGDLVKSCYPSDPVHGKRHRVAVLRAAPAATARCGWIIGRTPGRPGELVFFNPVDLLSYAVAGAWVMIGKNAAEGVGRFLAGEAGTTVPEEVRRLVTPSGLWALRVQHAHAQKAGHRTRAATLCTMISKIEEDRAARGAPSARFCERG